MDTTNNEAMVTTMEPLKEYSDKSTDMTTMVTILDKLAKKGFDKEFRWAAKGFHISDSDKHYQPEELEIIKTYRFEGESSPSESSIIYIIESKDGTIGYTIDAYGAYSNHEDEAGYDEFVKNIPVIEKDERLIFEP
ncbi:MULTISPECIES: hypothetical protein [Emticicia]|uniref:hypothetical protein n=1 Tax=Emticicia TaxID=312278 RepID=UPI00209CCAC3|nr:MULTISPECIES: hypothetical protein [Emticicia]UTA69616.1 hypothetical protein MB380_07350 [Emticicia sp. 21SJ11W-3]